MRKILMIASALLLTNCSTLNTIDSAVHSVATPDNFSTVVGAYGSALAIATTYRDFCQRKVINKSCWKVIATLQPYENEAYKAYVTLKAFVQSNPTDDASSLVNKFKNTVDNFKNTQVKNGVQ